MKSTRTVWEYRVLSKRVGNDAKDKRYRSLKSVRTRIGLLTSPEPWRFYGDKRSRLKDADDYACCAGTVHDQCACGGLTMAEATAEKRALLPDVEWIRVEKRQITTTPWEASEPL